jgi:hypothetical protein
VTVAVNVPIVISLVPFSALSQPFTARRVTHGTLAMGEVSEARSYLRKATSERHRGASATPDSQ